MHLLPSELKICTAARLPAKPYLRACGELDLPGRAHQQRSAVDLRRDDRVGAMVFGARHRGGNASFASLMCSGRIAHGQPGPARLVRQQPSASATRFMAGVPMKRAANVVAGRA